MGYRITKTEQGKFSMFSEPPQEITDTSNPIQLGNLSVEIKHIPNNNLRVTITGIDPIRKDSVILTGGTNEIPFDLNLTFERKFKALFDQDISTLSCTIKPNNSLDISTQTLDKRYILSII